MPHKDPQKHAEYHAAYRERNRQKQREYAAAWRAKNPEWAKDNVRKWHEQNPDKSAALRKRTYERAKARGKKVHNREKFLLSTYGLTMAAYDRLLADQGHVCAVCGGSFEEGRSGKAPVVDHNHVSGKVRGILHRSCNSALGLLLDNPVVLDNAARYLRATN